MKSWYQLALLAVLMVLAMLWRNAGKKNERLITIGGIEISYKPCEEGFEQFFNDGVDLSKACSCIYASSYNSIKNDSLKLKEFEINKGLDFEALDTISALHFYRDCIVNSIIDTTAKINLPKEGKLSFKKAMQSNFNFESYLDSSKSQKIYDCVTEKISHITIKDYFSNKDPQTAPITILVDSCVNQIK